MAAQLDYRCRLRQTDPARGVWVKKVKEQIQRKEEFREKLWSPHKYRNTTHVHRQCTCIWVSEHHQNLKTSSHHEADILAAEGLNDGWNVLQMAKCRVKMLHINVLLIYVLRHVLLSAFSVLIRLLTRPMPDIPYL